MKIINEMKKTEFFYFILRVLYLLLLLLLVILLLCPFPSFNTLSINAFYSDTKGTNYIQIKENWCQERIRVTEEEE